MDDGREILEAIEPSNNSRLYYYLIDVPWFLLKDSFKWSIKETYSADGVDLHEKTINGCSLAFETDDAKSYIYDPWTLLTSFLGLPNRRLNNDTRQSLQNIGKNFIGWQEHATASEHIARAIAFSLFNIVSTPLKLLLNCFKLVTEVTPLFLLSFIPNAFAVTTTKLGELYDRSSNIHNLFLKIGAKALSGLGYIISATCCLATSIAGLVVSQVGKAITSPANTVKAAWNATDDGFLNLFLATFSVLTTVAAYALFLPLAAKQLIVHAPAAISKIAAPVLEFGYKIGKPISKFMTSVFTYGKVNVSAILSQSPLLTGLGTLIGGFAATIGVKVKRAYNRLMKRVAKPAEPIIQPNNRPPVNGLGSTARVIQQAQQQPTAHRPTVDSRPAASAPPASPERQGAPMADGPPNPYNAGVVDYHRLG